MTHQRIFWFLMSILSLTSSAAVASAEETVRITALMFKTEPWNVPSAIMGPDEDGIIKGTAFGFGTVTLPFPEAVIHLKLDGVKEFNKEAIPAAIKRRFVLPSRNEPPVGPSAVWFGRDIFFFRNGTFSKTADEYSPADWSEFDLELLSRREKTWIVAARFALLASDNANLSELKIIILNEIINLRPAEPILIGFPYADPQKGKIEYWVALLLEE
jgi:hypothetical protein